MAANSKIEWCDHTFNPVVGCTKLSAACDNCYAESWAKRTGQSGLWSGERRRTSATNWRQPIRWNRLAEESNTRPKVFCASLADVFDNQWDTLWRSDLWTLIGLTPHLDWLLLTKRPQNIAKMLPSTWGAGWPNVWFGTTVENQEEADRRIPHLLSVPARLHFLSCEPLLGHVHLPPQDAYWQPIDWVICGGESGPNARPMHPNWGRSLRDQCVAVGVPFFMKQWGEYHPADQVQNAEQIKIAGDVATPLQDGRAVDLGDQWTWKIGKKAAGALLDGREWRQFPARGETDAP